MIRIDAVQLPSDIQKQAIYNLWNAEYPAQLAYKHRSELDTYLADLNAPRHYFAVADNGQIAGWAFSFLRENERWFAIIVDSNSQRSGLGRMLLNALKGDSSMLYGWVTDHNRYLKADGRPYPSPLEFYTRNEFEICREIRLEIEKLSAIKIKWKRI